MALKSLNSKGKIVSLGEFKHTQEQIRRRQRSGFIITSIFILAIAVVWYLLTLLPPTGKVELIRRATIVTTPAAGEVLWHIPRGNVRAGQHIATILIRFDANFNDLLRQYVNRCDNTQNRLLDVERQRGKLLGEQHDILMELNRQKSQLKIDAQRVNQRKQRLKDAEKRVVNATRLWHLDAIKKAEYNATKIALSEAQHQLSLATLAYNERKQKIALHEHSADIVDSRVNIESHIILELQHELAEHRESFDKFKSSIHERSEGLELSLFAPISGEVMDVIATTSSNVDANGGVVEIVRPGGAKLVAYLNPKYRTRVDENAKVEVRFGNTIFDSKIINTHSTLQRLPKPLRVGQENPEARYWVLELDCDDLPYNLANGELGEVIFYKGG